MPGILAGMLLVFALASSSYSVAALMGGWKVWVLPIHIYQQVSNGGHWQFGAAIAVILFAVNITAIFVYQGRGRARRRGAGMNDSARLPWPIKLGSALALIVLLLPVVIVVLAGLNAGDYLTFPPQGLSLRWVIAFLQSETFFGAYLFSLGLAAITMAISTVIGTMASIYLTRSPSAGAKVMRGLFLSPIVLPGIVLGLALYVFYVSTDIGLARTFGGLLIGHVLVTCPFVIATVSASLVGFDLSLEEAARSLGAGPLQAFRLVTLKIISPAVGAGSIFAFIISFGQFDLSLYLGTTKSDGAALCDVHLAPLQVRADRRRRRHLRDRAGHRLHGAVVAADQFAQTGGAGMTTPGFASMDSRGS